MGFDEATDNEATVQPFFLCIGIDPWLDSHDAASRDADVADRIALPGDARLAQDEIERSHLIHQENCSAFVAQLGVDCKPGGLRRFSAPDDQCHRSAAVGPLMLGAARHIDFRMPDQPGQCTANKSACVSGRRNVGVFQHGVAMAAQPAVVARLRLGEDGDKAPRVGRREVAPPPEVRAGPAPRAPARRRSRPASRRDRWRAGLTRRATCRTPRSHGRAVRRRRNNWLDRE